MSASGETVGALALLVVLSGAAQAQNAPLRHVEAGISAGLFVDYPSERADPYCEQKSAGVVGHGAYWLQRWVAVQGSLVLSGAIGDEFCVGPNPPVRIGDPFQRNVYEEGDFGGSLFSTSLGVVLEPFRGSDVSPRASGGMGWIVTHGMRQWYLGGGFRFAFGRNALTMDAERWSFDVRIRSETAINRPITGFEVLESTTFDSTLSMFLIRVGWAVDVR